MDDKKDTFIKEFLPAREKLMAFILSMVPDYDRAEEIFQQASVVFWEKYDTYTPGTNFKAWARKIIYHMILKSYQQQGKERSWSNEAIQAIEEAWERKEEKPNSRAMKSLESCIKRLSKINHVIIRMKYYEGKTYREIADALDRTEKGTKVIAHRIRTFLADCISRQEAQKL